MEIQNKELKDPLQMQANVSGVGTVDDDLMG